MPATPEFVLWSLARECPLRDHARGLEPPWVERQLRSLRSCGEALAEHREFEGVCLESSAGDPATVGASPMGFRTAEVLAAYGDQAWLDALCPNCPAHAVGGVGASRWAGCYGWIDWSALEDRWLGLVDEVVGRSWWASLVARHFLVTRPAWYGLWASSPLTVSQVQLLTDVTRALSATDSQAPLILDGLQQALDASTRHGLPLHVSFGARGTLDGNDWVVAAHCRRCHAERPEGSRRCGVCGQPGPAVEPRRRKARGSRPYLPLARFLGAAQVDGFLDRYWRQRGAR